MNTKLFKPVIPVVLCALCLIQSGCVTAIKHGNVVSITESGLGVKVSTANSSTQTPDVTLGFFRTQVTLLPTGTNGVPPVAPNVAATFKASQSAAPFNFGVDETIAAGNYQTGANSNNISSQPVVPK